MLARLEKTLLLRLARTLQKWADVLLRNLDTEEPKAGPEESSWSANPVIDAESAEQAKQTAEDTKPIRSPRRELERQSSHASTSSFPRRQRVDPAPGESAPIRPDELESHSVRSEKPGVDTGTKTKRRQPKPEAQMGQRATDTSWGLEQPKRCLLDVSRPTEPPISKRASKTSLTHTAAPAVAQSPNEEQAGQRVDVEPSLRQKIGHRPLPEHSASSLASEENNWHGLGGTAPRQEPRLPVHSETPTKPPPIPARQSSMTEPVRASTKQNAKHEVLWTDWKSVTIGRRQTEFECAEPPAAPETRWPNLPGESGRNIKIRPGIAADRWPELPVDTGATETQIPWAESLEASATQRGETERLRRLDLEQRGVLWNA